MSISREVLAKYITPGCVFIETGTRWGDTCIKAIELGADAAYTCENEASQHLLAQLHITDALRRESIRISVIHMDSVRFLEATNDHPNTVVFLDAHTESESPVLAELGAISRRWKFPPVYILIDDLRCMSGWRISEAQLTDALRKIGTCAISYEEGVESADILVARYSYPGGM